MGLHNIDNLIMFHEIESRISISGWASDWGDIDLWFRRSPKIWLLSLTLIETTIAQNSSILV